MIKVTYRDVQRGTELFKRLLAQLEPMEVHGRDGLMFYITFDLKGPKNASKDDKFVEILKKSAEAKIGWSEQNFVPDTDFGI